MRPALVMWAIYIFLIPLYVFKSGLPQPGDIFLIALVPVALRGWNGRLFRRAHVTFKPLFWFTAWVCMVDYAWAAILGNFGLFGPDTFVLFPIYYVYNTLLFLVALVLFQRYGDAFLRLTIYVIYLTIFLQVGSSFLSVGGARGALFFNNPNQLGYYALLVACLIVLLHWRLRLRLVVSSFALTCCGYLAAVSASRAAIAGIAILFALLVFSNPRVILGVSAAAIALMFVGGPVSTAIDASQDRVRNRKSHVGFFAERGYDRIWEHKQYLVFGAGEGGLSRFSTIQMEIHSSLGTVVFSYGLVGTLFFLAFMWRLIRGAPLRYIAVLIPPLAYTAAHQGLRFTMFWVLLAVFVALKPAVVAAKVPRVVKSPTYPRANPLGAA